MWKNQIKIEKGRPTSEEYIIYYIDKSVEMAKLPNKTMSLSSWDFILRFQVYSQVAQVSSTTNHKHGEMYMWLNVN